jgi:hypothetical protein
LFTLNQYSDKTGDARFYERILPQAEKIWVQYQEELEGPSLQ